MRFQSALAIYFLFWFLSLFFVLPFHARTSGEAGAELVPGQAESAPHRFPLANVALWTTIVSAVLFGLFYLNYVFGWITADALDWAAPPRR
ncbi:DUF1467 family protein [Sphingomonas baiyangensis]|uniref:DUF1467 family protein n=1 Tax=Sphingomonas baiyangensis TaxID=2572576 RepID=A0A4U1L3M6_9SPHN|nr:DUF1467 family protein [Sphingomonas baiyangensis]TKD50830.1 DUF1467 family protein [Sphingomonas baiyangensis]